MQHVLALAQRVGPTRATVLIHGETGTGKDLIAQYIHRSSPRRDKPMQVFNCHGVPETLLESELFGHERGAFTGAVQARSGLFERAHGTSLLLDEVGDIPRPAQAKLLRILQERRFTRLGGTASLNADVRVIATTQHDLRALAAKGHFREDLFYRLNVFPIHVPPLRDRREEIGALAAIFLESSARKHRARRSPLSDQALALLIGYDWPGNVRELQSALERGQLLANGEPITENHLPQEILEGAVLPRDGENVNSLEYAQRLLVSRTLHETRWNYTDAASKLGVSAHVLRQLTHRLQLKRV